jgi:hypothetical protein
MEENQSASKGLLVRVKRCRWREGIVLKKERQGRTRGWRTRGLLKIVSAVLFDVEVNFEGVGRERLGEGRERGDR